MKSWDSNLVHSHFALIIKVQCFWLQTLLRKDKQKHIRIPEHYIREVVELEEIKLYYIPTNLQFADIFTKNLGKQKFQEGRNALQLSRF